MRICTACSKENPDYLKRCLDCGKGLDASPVKSLVRIYLIGLVVVGVAIGFIVVKKPFTGVSEKNASPDQAVPELTASPVTAPAPPPLKAEPAAPVAPIVEEKKLAVVPSNEPEKSRSNPAVVSVVRADSTPSNSGPKPRKRVQHQNLDTADILAGTSPTTLKVNGSLGGNLSSASEAYMRALHSAIVKEYIDSLAKMVWPMYWGNAR